MTTAAIKASESETYSVLRYERGGKFVCWVTKIGYKKNAKGDRVRSWKYHTKDYAKAQRNALELGERWEAIVKPYKAEKRKWDMWRRITVESAKAGGYYLDDDNEKVPFDGTDSEVRVYLALLAERNPPPEPPVWPTDEKPRRQEQYNLDRPGHRTTVEEYTLEQARQKYIASHKERVGLVGPRGIKEDSHYSHDRDLRIAFGGLDDAMPVSELDRAAIDKFVKYWLSPDRKIGERSATNYLRAFKQMLDALPGLNVGYTKPDINDLFVFRSVKAKIAKYDKDQLKTLLNAVDERCKLYQLLAANCGFTQVDICNLKLDEIVKIKGDTYIVRRRDKTSHQNDFTSQWWLWPETSKLLMQQLAQPNPNGLALLRPDGSPLKKKAGNNNYVGEQWKRIRDAFPDAAKTFTLKQWRKIGFTAIKRLTKNPDIARKYAAQVIEGAAGHYDRDDFFGDLTKALKDWRKELLKDKVLP